MIHRSWDMTLSGSFDGAGIVGREGFPSDGEGKLLPHPTTTRLFQGVS